MSEYENVRHGGLGTAMKWVASEGLFEKVAFTLTQNDKEALVLEVREGVPASRIS